MLVLQWSLEQALVLESLLVLVLVLVLRWCLVLETQPQQRCVTALRCRRSLPRARLGCREMTRLPLESRLRSGSTRCNRAIRLSQRHRLSTRRT